VTFLDALPDPVREFAMGQDLVRYSLGGDGRFCYAYARVEESPEFLIWIYQFYLRHWAGAVTKPDGRDLE
jgi:hypothetical protein